MASLKHQIQGRVVKCHGFHRYILVFTRRCGQKMKICGKSWISDRVNLGNHSISPSKTPTTPTIRRLLIITAVSPGLEALTKNMLNSKMVFRVTKSQSMKDKISFI